MDIPVFEALCLPDHSYGAREIAGVSPSQFLGDGWRKIPINYEVDDLRADTATL
jgi:hypothetical protein